MLKLNLEKFAQLRKLKLISDLEELKVNAQQLTYLHIHSSNKLASIETTESKHYNSVKFEYDSHSQNNYLMVLVWLLYVFQ